MSKLGTVQIDVSLDEAGIAKAKKKMEELEKIRRVRYQVEVNANKAQEEIDKIQARIDLLGKNKDSKALAGLTAELEKWQGKLK